MKRPARLCALLLLLAATALPAAAEEAVAAEALGPTLARELARLDERLALGTDPDGTGDWLARVAAVLEYRVRHPEAAGAGGPDLGAAPELMRHLAHAVRGLGVTEDLEAAPGAEPAAPDDERAARLRAALAAARVLHAKLDPPPPVTGLPAALPANDSCAAAAVIAVGTVSGTTAGASNDGTASCGSSNGSPDVWFRYTAAADGWTSFDTFGSSFDTVLSVRDGCPGSGSELACSDDAGGTAQSAVNLELTAGQEVWVRVSGYAGGAGAFQLTLDVARGIAGTVTAAATGAPVEGAEVTISYGWSSSEVAETAADGTYRVGNLDAGTYYARAEAAGFIDQLWENEPCPSWDYCWSDDGTPITVADGFTSGIDFALSPGGTLRGALTDAATGQAITGYVSLYSIAGGFLDSFYTGSGGIYELAGVPVGKYYLRAQASGYQRELYDDLPCPDSCSITSGTQVAVLANTTTEADFALDRLGAITGRLTEDPSGAAIGSQRVVVGGPSYDGSAYTTSDGSYRMANLPPSTYSVWTETQTHRNELYDGLVCAGSCSGAGGTPVEVVLNGDTGGIDFALQRLGSIAGRVVHGPTGEPMQGVRVVASNSTGGFARYTSTLADGSYLVGDLPAGSYRVQTVAYWSSDDQADELYDDVPCWNGCDPAAATLVAVELATTTPGVDFRLDRLPSLEGTVLSSDTGSTLFMDVRLYEAAGALVNSEYSYSSGFRFSGIPPGTYYLATGSSNSDFHQAELYPDVPCEPSCDLSLGTPLTLALNGSVVGVEIVLEPCPAQSYASFLGTVFLSTHLGRACERLTAGSGTVVESGAAVTFRAGRSVVLGSGFAVRAGGSFSVQLEPTWAQP